MIWARPLFSDHFQDRNAPLHWQAANCALNKLENLKDEICSDPLTRLMCRQGASTTFSLEEASNALMARKGISSKEEVLKLMTDLITMHELHLVAGKAQENLQNISRTERCLQFISDAPKPKRGAPLNTMAAWHGDPRPAVEVGGSLDVPLSH